jgi:hypothetical protein
MDQADTPNNTVRRSVLAGGALLFTLPTPRPEPAADLPPAPAKMIWVCVNEEHWLRLKRAALIFRPD